MKVFFIGLFILVIGGIVFPLFTYYRDTKKQNRRASGNKKQTNVKKEKESDQYEDGEYTLNRSQRPKNSKFDYTQDILDFDTIVTCNKDAALLKINDYDYLGFLEVQGVPFNLLSIQERLSLEENYGELLNGIDYPFQMFIQSRSLKLDNYVDRYREKVEELKKKVKTLEEKVNLEKDPIAIERLNIEINKKSRQLQYGYALLNDFKIKNVDSELLERRYYIILKYEHNDEFGDLTDHEILEFAYNDLGNKANLFIDTLTRNKLACKFLNSVQIGELLYNAFNKDDASSLKIENAIKSKFNHLCTTSQPIYLKEIENEINRVSEEQKVLERNILESYKKVVN